MNSAFKGVMYEITTIILLVGHLFWNLSMLIHLANIMAIVPAVIQLVAFYFLYTRHKFLATSLKIWAGYLFMSGGVAFGSKLLLGLAREIYPEGIEWKVAIILTGFLLWWIATKKIILIQSHPEDNF